MDNEKVVITDLDSYGLSVESPEFKPEIKITFAEDVPAKTRIEMQRLANSLEDEKDAKELVILNEKFAALIVLNFVKDWNLYDDKDNKLPISVETLEKRISSRLLDWITKKAYSFLALTTRS